MRIAIALENGQVAEHLGHCPGYLIAEVQDNAVTATTEVVNPRHGPSGPPPVFLANLGVKHVVGWGAPEHFLHFLSRLDIKYTLGAKGEANQVLQDFLKGTLVLDQGDTRVECNHDHE